MDILKANPNVGSPFNGQVGAAANFGVRFQMSKMCDAGRYRLIEGIRKSAYP